MRSCGVCCKVFATGTPKHSCRPPGEAQPGAPAPRVPTERDQQEDDMSEAACLHMQHDQWGFCTECGADIYQQDEATQVRSRHLVPEWLIGGSVADGEGGVIGKLRMTTWPSDNPEGDWILMDPDERDEWCEWFERHGIDPDGVAVPGSVVADDATRRISYVAWEKGEITRVGRVVQLEARALPFPPPSAEWSSPETGV